MDIDPPCPAGARRRNAWRAWVLCGLFAWGSASAELLTLTGLPEINQHDTPGHVHNPAFDRNAADGLQDGEFWCVPVATASVLLWLADHYHRPDIIPPRRCRAALHLRCLRALSRRTLVQHQ